VEPPLTHPALNATLNALSALCLVAGYLCIRRKRIQWHRGFMSAAFLLSTGFLVSYVIYHLEVGSVRFQGQGWIRPVYFTLLLTHIVLAAAILPLALLTLARALREQFDLHRRIARWTLPIWLYVSLTGVLIYWLLYHAYAPAAL
jgi:putative membrane protein